MEEEKWEDPMHVIIKNNINNNTGIGETSRKEGRMHWKKQMKNTKKLSSNTTEGIDIIVHEMEGNEWKAMNDGRHSSRYK